MGKQPLDVSGETHTVQSAADECNINTIVARAKRGEDISALVRQGRYGDFTNIPSYREALNLVNRGRDLFMSLDAEVRLRFGNDPARLIEFLQDENNRDEAIKLGLVVAKEVPKADEHLDTLKSIDKSLKAESSSRAKRAKSDEE